MRPNRIESGKTKKKSIALFGIRINTNIIIRNVAIFNLTVFTMTGELCMNVVSAYNLY